VVSKISKNKHLATYRFFRFPDVDTSHYAVYPWCLNDGEKMSDALSDFIAAMREAGCAPSSGDVIADDVLHRFHIDGDKPRSENGAYRLQINPDGFGVGWFKNWKTGETTHWHSKTSRKATAEEKEAAKKRIQQMKEAREAADAEAKRLAVQKAAKLWADAKPVTGDEPYLVRKGITGEGCRVIGDSVVVPLRKDGKLVGLQFIQDDGDKRFLNGSDVHGAYHSMARKGDDLSTIVIGEGMATMASVRAAMGWPCIVAFNAGNLKEVAKVIRNKYPDARIVICADNDQWTVIKGKPVNVGIEAAQQAAVSIGGAQVVWPAFPSDDEARRTDWNDMHVSDGLDAVRAGLSAAPTVQKADVPEIDDWQPISEEELIEVHGDDPLSVIRPMGHDRGDYYFMPKSGGQIVRVGATALGRIQTLYRLAPRGFWENHYGTPGNKVSDSEIASYASAHLIEACHRIGVFEANKVRGVGVWIDGGRTVVNCGDVLICDKQKIHPSDFKGRYLYESGAAVIDLDCEPLHNKESARLRDACKLIKFKRPQYADLLAGWIVIAMIGSAVVWRPHIVITGPKGSGKSTIVDDVIKAALGDVAINGDGGTTEPGARRLLGLSGRPFIMDEAESENKSTQTEMAKIFFLARRGSKGGKISNAYADFIVRSCFCFAAINPRIEQGADKDRITTLELVVDKSASRKENYATLMRAIKDCMVDNFPQRLMARTVEHIDSLFHNIKVFTSVASDVFGNQRDGDQIGALLAGSYSLVSTNKVTLEFAREWMDKQEWDWHGSDNDMTDAEKLVTHIMTLRVRYDHDGRSYESSIGDMVSAASIKGAPGYDAADKGLRGYGIRVIDGRIVIANNSPQLKRMLDDTPWAVWRGTLSNYPGADNYGNKPVYFGSGFECKATSLPLDRVMGRVEAVQDDDVDIGFGDDFR